MTSREIEQIAGGIKPTIAPTTAFQKAKQINLPIDYRLSLIPKDERVTQATSTLNLSSIRDSIKLKHELSSKDFSTKMSSHVAVHSARNRKSVQF